VSRGDKTVFVTDAALEVERIIDSDSVSHGAGGSLTVERRD
jgi:hypothetical protein